MVEHNRDSSLAGASELLVEYHLPTVGPVRARLFPLAAKCFQLLDAKGHIERLRQIDQLGVVRRVRQGAHHSRWEYVVAQLTLIHQLAILKDEHGNPVVQGCGLRSDTDFPDHDGGRASRADLMQCWALLLNMGHLHGTFATELAMLRSLRNDGTLRRAFLSDTGFHDREARDFCRSVIQRGNVYDMHKAIAFFFLFRYCRTPKKALVQTLIDVLKYYCCEQYRHSQGRQTVRHVYRRVRQLCYLAIDSLYAAVTMQINLGSVLLNLREIGPDLASVTDSPLCSELDSFNELMTREVYCSPRTLLEHERHAQYVTRQIDRFYRDHRESRRHEISDMRRLLQHLQSDVGRPVMSEHDVVLYLPIATGPFVNELPDAEELHASLRALCGRRHVTMSVLTDPRDNRVHIAAGIERCAPRRAVLRCFAGLAKILYSMLDDGFLGELAPDLQAFFRCSSSVCTNCVKELVETILGFLSENSSRFRIRGEGGITCYVNKGSQKTASALSALSDSTFVRTERRHEVGTHADALVLCYSLILG